MTSLKKSRFSVIHCFALITRILDPHSNFRMILVAVLVSSCVLHPRLLTVGYCYGVASSYTCKRG